jgi:hypothetical protein
MQKSQSVTTWENRSVGFLRKILQVFPSAVPHVVQQDCSVHDIRSSIGIPWQMIMISINFTLVIKYLKQRLVRNEAGLLVYWYLLGAFLNGVPFYKGVTQ